MARIVSAIFAALLLLYIGGYAQMCDCAMDASVDRVETSGHTGSCHEEEPVQRSAPCSGSDCCGHCMMSEKVAVNNVASRPAIDRTLLEEQPISCTSRLHVDERHLWANPYENGEADYFSSHILIFTYFPQAPPLLVS